MLVLEQPLSMLLDRGVHRIRRKVQFSGPRYRSVFNLDLREYVRVGKRGKHSGLWRMHETGHIDHPEEAIDKCNL
jgi:hypothetical protein